MTTPRRSRTRGQVILEVLRRTYGNGGMVDALAATIESRWDEWAAGKGSAKHYGLEYAVHMECWNWFAGGGTAEIVAKRVVDAVEVSGE